MRLLERGARRKEKIFAVIILTIILASLLLLGQSIFKPKPRHLSLNPSPQSERWHEYAEIAWKYYSPWRGWNPETGLPWTNPYYHRLNGWDLGAYIVAIVDAEKLGIITKEKADKRLDKVMNFLANRQLTKEGIPCIVYDSDTGLPVDGDPGSSNVSDEGRFLIALHLLRVHRPELNATINHIVYEKCNYTKLANSWDAWKTTRDYYAYYVAQGFKLFGFDKYEPVADALRYMEKLKEKERKGDVLNYYGVEIPNAETTSEPLLLGILDLNLNSLFKKFAYQVYRVQEERYYQRGIFTAWSEGQYDAYEVEEFFIYEWINGWRVTNTMGKKLDISPVVFTKVAFAMDAIFRTHYTQMMVNKLLSYPELITDYGFLEGINEEGRPLTGRDGHYLNFLSMTNSMIISAARYALEQPQRYALHDFPIPFVDPAGKISASLVVGSNVPYGTHGPCGGAYMIDLTAAITLAGSLGLNATSGKVKAFVDEEITNFDAGQVFEVKAEGNLITFGSFGVNLVTRYYNARSRHLPACMMADETGIYIYVPSTDHRYYMKNDYWQGKNVTDYGMIVLHYDMVGERYVLISCGFSGYSTRATTAYLSNFDVNSLKGVAMIIEFYDEQGDGVHERITVVEVVYPYFCHEKILPSRNVHISHELAKGRRIEGYFMLLLRARSAMYV